MHKLWFDVETTGLDYKVHSLLQAYFAVYDENDNFIDDLYLQLKPEDPSKIVVTEEAMNITGINLQEHLSDPETITYEEGKNKLQVFLEKHKIKGKRKHYIPSGHNILFDLLFLWEQMVPRNEWEVNIHYGKRIDTYEVVTFLQDIGYLPPDLGRLTPKNEKDTSSLTKYFNIPVDQAHNARGDIKMNIEVYKKLKDLMATKKIEIANTNTNSLLEIIER